MRYKTKRTILRIFRYIIYSFLIILGYSYSAHRKYLPAFFEYYTGDVVRNSTSQYYKLFAGDSSETSAESFSIMNIVDSILREPAYLYVTDILDTLSTDVSEISPDIKDESIRVATHPALIEWLKNPGGAFASVYKYESIRYIESSGSFKNFMILNKNGKTFHQSGNINGDIGTLKNNQETQYYNGLISIPVKSDDVVLGRVISSVENNLSGILSFQNTGIDISWLWIDQKNKISSSNLTANYIKKWIEVDRYSGPLGGIEGGYRFVSRPLHSSFLILVYPAESALYYLFKILVITALLGSLALIVYFWIKANPVGRVKTSVMKLGKNKAVELLEKSNMVNQEYASLAVKYQNSIQSMKIQEIDRLRMISEHLTYIHKSIYNPDQEEVLEVKSLD